MGHRTEPLKGDADAHGGRQTWREQCPVAGVCAQAEQALQPAFGCHTAQGPATGPGSFYSTF